MSKVFKINMPATYNFGKHDQTITECLPLPYELSWEKGNETMLFAKAAFMLVFREIPANNTSCFTAMTRASKLGDLVAKELLSRLEYSTAKYFAMSVIAPLRMYLEKRQAKQQKNVAAEVETASENGGGVETSVDAEASGNAETSGAEVNGGDQNSGAAGEGVHQGVQEFVAHLEY
jgi:hypothetical protein